MRKYFFLLTVFFATQFAATAQDDDYWQQTVNYTINVKLDDEKHFLHGQESIEYINNSPDELTFIWFHLWPNAYKNNGTAFAKQQLLLGSTSFYFSKDEQKGYIDSLDFEANGEKLRLEYHPDYIDVAKVYLNEPLAPGESIIINTPFRVKIPDSFSRLGHVGQQYQITQWYPKPAVYDQEGWHPMPYLDMGEFYSEFGRFEVNITIPQNYIVGATGNLQTESEITFMDSLADEKWQESIYRYSETFKKSSDTTKTITYVQDNVHDFAWFADKTYRVVKGSIELPHSGREVALYALYNNNNFDTWEDIITYMEDATYYYSKWIGDYAYDVITVVDGALSAGAGMEYPTITVLGASDEFSLEIVTMHEIGHNWFYGIIASNERAHAWMDEGINSYYERRYIETKYPNKKLVELLGVEEAGSFFQWLTAITKLDDIDYERYYGLGYSLNANRNEDQPPGLHASEFTYINYGTMVYMKPAVVFTHLEKYLGADTFDQIMKTYFERWKFKHPKPEDIKQLFEEESGKDLVWVFDDLIKTSKKLDYKISKVEPFDDGIKLTLKNKARIPAPMPVMAHSGDDTVSQVFVEGFKGTKTLTIPGQQIDRITLDPNHFTLDLYRHNNQAYPDKLMKKSNPLKILPIGGIELDDKSELYFLPTFGLNTRDKFMLGASFYNNLLPQQKFNFVLNPMYSFGLNQLSGSGQVNYNFYPRSLFQNVKLGINGRRFAGYNKLAPSLDFTFKKKSLNTSPTQKLSFSYNLIDVAISLLPIYKPYYEVVSGSYQLQNFKNAIFGYSLSTEMQSEPGNWAAWNNEAITSYQYMQGKFMRLRLFYGQFLNSDNLHPSFQLGMSGSTDYLMESTFLDRAIISQRFVALEHQTDLQQGGFRNYLVGAFSDDWLFAANFDLEIPFIGIFSIYGDVGLLPGQSYYDAGLRVGLLRDAVRIYFPIAGSNFGGFAEGFDAIGEQIRFSLHLNQINPLKIIQNIGS
jgi:hypothetical protein